MVPRLRELAPHGQRRSGLRRRDSRNLGTTLYPSPGGTVQVSVKLISVNTAWPIEHPVFVIFNPFLNKLTLALAVALRRQGEAQDATERDDGD